MIAANWRKTVGLLLCGGLLACFTAAAAPKNEKLDAARDYVLYYGGADKAALEELARYDVVIIDPQALGGDAKKKIAWLKKKGCLVIGYLSYMEVAEWHRYKKRIPESWRLKVNGKYWQPWGQNYAIDLMNPDFRKLLVELTQSEVASYGCEGVFMDTLADIDNPALPANMRKEQLRGLELLMKELRKAYPKFVFIGNWTIQETLPVMGKYADVICWENFNPKFFRPGDSNNTFVFGIRKNIDALRKKHNFKVYALWAPPHNYYEYRDDYEEMKKLAASYGYLAYSCLEDYHKNLTRKPKAGK